jgi:methyl-accepting chemotaxis protein
MVFGGMSMVGFRNVVISSTLRRISQPVSVGSALFACVFVVALTTTCVTALCIRRGLFDAWSVFGACTELLVILAAEWYMWSTGRRIRFTALVASRIATGSLSFSLQPSGRDELSELLASLESTRQNLARMAAVTQQGAARLAHAAGGIAGENGELAERTAAQAAALEQSAAASSELASIAQENAHRGTQGEQLSRSLSSQAHGAHTSISSAVSMIQDVRLHARHIASITETINAIAIQTRMLALNAAIVSTKAGTQGRGFAVVAAEVRRLADRTAEAAHDIAGLTSSAEDKAKHAETLTEAAQSDMRRLVDAVHQMTDSNEALNAASLEQCAAARELDTAISSVDELTQQNAQRVGSIAAAAELLHSQAKDLLALTNRFERGTRAHAVRIVSDAVAHIAHMGLESACEEFTHGEIFKELDLYVVVYDFAGLNLAQGADATMVGRNMLDLKDVNKIPIIRRLIDIATTQGQGWLNDYSFPNPVTGRLDSKSMYVQRAPGDVLVGCGVYGS